MLFCPPGNNKAMRAGVAAPISPDLRRHAVGLFTATLAANGGPLFKTYATVTPEVYARDLETCVFMGATTAAAPTHQYLRRVSQLHSNLEGNALALLQRFKVWELPTVSDDTLLNTTQEEQTTKEVLRRVNAFMAGVQTARASIIAKQASDNLVQFSTERCKCRSFNVQLVALRQLRSADEGMTATYECRDCHRQWKRT